jgi:L-iditol 2-dehydrogenase
MRLVRLHGVGDLRLHEEPAPDEAPPGWSVVEVTSVGLCGSDLHWFTDGGIGENRIDSPVVPGHEFAGVARTGPYAGQRVAVDPAIPCGRCESCRAGHGNLCPQVRFAGHGSLDGGLRERMVWPDHLLVPLPDRLSDDAGALLEPLGVAIHAVKLAHLRLGADVLVVGAGPIGVLASQVAIRSGAGRVFVSEPLPHRREAALAGGVHDAWAPQDVDAALQDATGGRGVDVVIEMAGTDAAIATGISAARPGARVVLGGIPDDDTSSFTASTARRKGLTFVMVRRMHETYSLAISLATSGLDLDALVSSRYPLEDAGDAFAAAAQRTGGKVVVAVSSSPECLDRGRDVTPARHDDDPHG